MKYWLLVSMLCAVAFSEDYHMHAQDWTMGMCATVFLVVDREGSNALFH